MGKGLYEAEKRVFDEVAEGLQEAGSGGTVVHAMIKGEAERESITRGEGAVVQRHGLAHDGTDAENGGLGGIDDRGECLDPEAAEIAEREASALHVCGSELTGAGGGDKLLRLCSDMSERGGADVADDGDEQARLGVHSDAEVDAFGEQEMILRPSGGEHGMLAQSGGGEFDEDVVDGGDRVLE